MPNKRTADWLIRELHSGEEVTGFATREDAERAAYERNMQTDPTGNWNAVPAR